MKSYSKKLLLSLLMILTNIVYAEGWNSLYLGGNVNYINAEDDVKEIWFNAGKGNGVWEEDGWGQKNKPEGVGFGIQVGKNWVLDNNFLLGIELEYQKNNIKDKEFQREFSTGDDCAPATDCIFNTKLDQTFSTIFKAGYLVTDKTAIYALGGYTTSKIIRKIYDQGTRYTDRKWQDGYVVGVGLEYLLNNQWSLKTEYRYADLGKYTYDTDAFTGVKEKQDFDANQFNIGLNYHF